ncbi:MAG: hypothetical protein ACREXR_11075 [Gammaproteobacteria bacterium]
MEKMTMYYSQAGQDQFVLFCLRKRNGTFVEIGSFDPVEINNTYILEKEFQWSGLMIEKDASQLPKYQEKRPRSNHLIQDATTVCYAEQFTKLGFPAVIDYLMIDLEVRSQATIQCLRKLESEVMANYRFAVVTFEHDIYRSNYLNRHKYSKTRRESRQIFDRHGYVRVFSDVKNRGNPYEDWYVHPDGVDMSRIEPLITDESLEWTDIVRKFCS